MRATIGGFRDEVTILVVDDIAEIVVARFGHGIESVVEFVLVNIDAFLARLFQLSKTRWAWSTCSGSPSSFTQPSRVVTFTPSESSSVLQQLEIVGVERLHGARALKLQRAGFSHLVRNHGALRIAGSTWRTGIAVEYYELFSGNRKPAPNGCAPLATPRWRR